MKRVTLTAEALALLAGARESVELRDAEGRVVGFFDPVPTDVPGGWGPFTADEVAEAMRGEGSVCTLDDIGRKAGLL